jgi:ketosteroid isomerase-like protein
MRSRIAFTVLSVAIPAVASAHITIQPRESKPGIEQRYTVRVPTEGQVATTSVELQIPDGVTDIEVPAPEGATHEVKRAGDRVVAIVWTKEIPPKQSAQFIFVARNPGTGEQIAWNVRQHFADRSLRPWTPATKLVAGAAVSGGPAQAVSGDGAKIEAWLKEYDAAFNAKDLEKLGTFYHADVSVYEGGGINNGWADYRDRHLGPELKAFENLQFSHSNVTVHVLAGGQSAYATANYALKARMKERDVDSGGLATYILVKAADGTWKIRHSHTSSRPRRPAAGGN